MPKICKLFNNYNGIAEVDTTEKIGKFLLYPVHVLFGKDVSADLEKESSHSGAHKAMTVVVLILTTPISLPAILVGVIFKKLSHSHAMCRKTHAVALEQKKIIQIEPAEDPVQPRNEEPKTPEIVIPAEEPLQPAEENAEIPEIFIPDLNRANDYNYHNDGGRPLRIRELNEPFPTKEVWLEKAKNFAGKNRPNWEKFPKLEEGVKSIVKYVEQVLDQPSFQENPTKYVLCWQHQRIRKTRFPENDALEFFREELGIERLLICATPFVKNL